VSSLWSKARSSRVKGALVTNPNCRVVTELLLRQYNQRDLSVIDELVAEDHVDHHPLPGQQPGRAGYRQSIADVLARGNVTAEIHQSFGEDDLVATRYTITTRHNEDFMGFPTAGKTTAIHVVQINRVRDGKVAETWGESNALAVLQQLTHGDGH